MKKLIPIKQQVRKFLAGVIGSDINNLLSIDQGEWTTVYSFSTKNKNFIIRFSNFSEDFEKDKFAYSFASKKLPIPKITAMGQAFNGYYAISDKLPGIAIDLLDSGQVQRIIPSILNLFDALRESDISNTQGYGGWMANKKGAYSSWKQALLDINNDSPKKRIHGWKSKLKTSTIGVEPFSNIYQKFSSLVESCPEDRYLIHADLLHYNLLATNNQISAVLDWGCSQYGDFLYELAWFTFWSSWFPSMKGINFREKALQHYSEIGLKVPNFEERLLCYELHIGLDGITYSSFTQNWNQVEKVVKQTMELVE